MTAQRKHKHIIIGLVFIVVAGVFMAAQARPVSSDNVDELRQRVAELVLIVERLAAQVAAQQDWVMLTRDLTVGDSGADVRALQRLLNIDTRTHVAVAGDGAPGLETQFFGPKTAAAVARYQELYRNEVLVPEGLVSGTGYVGARTRAHMNETIAIQIQSTPEPNESPSFDQSRFTPEPNEMPDPNMYEPEPNESPNTSEEINLDEARELFKEMEVDPDLVDSIAISSISSYRARRGDSITISGYGFGSNENTVSLGGYTIKNLQSRDGRRITFTVPQDTPLGSHFVSVTSDGKKSSNTMLIVYEGTYTPPSVTSISPTEGLYGQEVTIRGSGFSKTNNMIRSSYGIIEGVPSEDGTALTFKVKPPVEGIVLKEGEDLGRDFEFEYYFFVVTNAGFSTEPVSFTLRI